MDVRVSGADELERIARKLKETGNKDLRKELHRGLARAAKPMRAAGRRAALDELPARGGLAKKIAASRYSTKTRSTGKKVGVRVTAKGPKNAGGGEIDIRSLNRGRLRHPVYARGDDRKKWTWVDQAVPPGWWEDAMQIAADEVVRDEMLAVLAEISRKLEGR